jgi:hypothetical protein
MQSSDTMRISPASAFLARWLALQLESELMAPESPCGPCKWWSAALFALAALLGVVAFRPIWDVDIFWHIAAGRWIIDNQAFPTVDIFTFVEPARDWVTFQWLYEVLCFEVDSVAGLTGVRVLHGVLTSLAFAAFTWFAVRYFLERDVRTELVLPLAALLLALLFALYADRVRARPHVFNLLFWSLVLGVLLTTKFRIWGKAALVASIMFAWSNLHAGGSFIFLVVLAAWPVSALLVARFGGEEPRWVIRPNGVRDGCTIWLVAAGAALVSPNWLLGVKQAYTMLGGSEALIEEWLPFFHYFAIASNPLHVLAGLIPIVGLVGVTIAMLKGRKRQLDVLLAALGLTLLPFRSARFVYFVAFALVLLVPYLPSPKVLIPKRWSIALSLTVAALLLGVSVDYHSRVQYGSLSGYLESFQQDMDERRFPVEFDDLIGELATTRDGSPLKIFCQPNWGGYLLYRHFPRVRVLADSRGNFSEDLGTRLHFIYLYRNDPRYGPAVEKIYDEAEPDILVMQHPVTPRGYELSNWYPLASSRKGRVLLRK